MKCSVCRRQVHWARARCPACKIKLPMWYVFVFLVVVMLCFGGWGVFVRVLHSGL
jgi:hypothetical protein